MLNLYAVTVWHSSEPNHLQTIEIRTYSARRAEELASETFPCCRAVAEQINDLIERLPTLPYLRPPARAH
jgi:hypothetical protein